jgi:hypothetical protein
LRIELSGLFDFTLLLDCFIFNFYYLLSGLLYGFIARKYTKIHGDGARPPRRRQGAPLQPVIVFIIYSFDKPP